MKCFKFQWMPMRWFKIFMKDLHQWNVNTTHALHRDLNFESHKRFCTRDFARWAFILDYGKSKKGCLNFGRNKSSHENSRDGVRTRALMDTLLDRILWSRLHNINFTKIWFNTTSKYSLVRPILVWKILKKSSSYWIKM